MRVIDKAGWSDVIYRLLYPSVLGSMLYDQVIVWQDPSFKWFLVAKTCIVLLFVLAYIHSYRDLDVAGEGQRGHLILIDAALALLFAVAYVCARWGSLRLTIGALVVSAAAIFIYPCTHELRGPVYWTGKALFLASAIVLGIVAFFLSPQGGWPVSWSLVATTVAYALHVFVFTEFSRRPAEAPSSVL